ncbi:MAG TPA: cupin domain-containing protein [bacterium]|nr:cupin domain-containing protein [bacterium]HQO36223.1 cupin domain-containing protein [bacterium]HQP98822.1 cupin domain-containing protein [bacterium]
MMSSHSGYLVRQPQDLQEERSTCGFRKRVFTADDKASMSASVVSIHDAKPHYHKETTEIYYVLEGTGALELDGDRVPLSPGSAVLIKPHVRHRATGDVVALVIGNPPFHTDDLYLVEE